MASNYSLVTASVAYSVKNALQGQGAIIPLLYYVASAGIIALITAPLTGAVFDRFGAHPHYIMAAVGTLATWLVLVLSQQRSMRKPAQIL